MTVPENYKKEQVTINLVWANVFGILILIPIALLYGTLYYLIWNEQLSMENFKNMLRDIHSGYALLYPLVIIAILILGIVLHELIHGITWAIFAKKGFKSIKFGVLWKMITPYCHCKEPLNVRQYITGAITPAIFLGFIPAIVAIAIGNMELLIFAGFFTMAACGDFLIIYSLRREKANTLVEDHPSEAGYYIYRKIEE